MAEEQNDVFIKRFNNIVGAAILCGFLYLHYGLDKPVEWYMYGIPAILMAIKPSDKKLVLDLLNVLLRR